MGLFSKNEKKIEPKGKPLDFDPLNVQLRDLRPGFFVDYNFKTFEITAGFDFTLKEYAFRTMKLDAGDEVVWLLIENGTDTFVVESVSLTVINAELQSLMANFGKPSGQLSYKDVNFSFENQSDGKFRDMIKNAMDQNRCTCWKYRSDNGSNRLFAIQKGQNTFEGLVAKSVNSVEFSNFLPKY